MIYTQQKRRALNKAAKAMFPDVEFTEPTGIPVMECNGLPSSARLIVDPDDFLARVNDICVRKNTAGMNVPDYGKSVPVFIKSMEYIGNSCRLYYRVNYVSPSLTSQEKAEEYISKGLLYSTL